MQPIAMLTLMLLVVGAKESHAATPDSSTPASGQTIGAPHLPPPDGLPAPGLLFRSGVLNARTPGQAVPVDISVEGVRTIYLVATDAGDGIACDFANWAEPRFISPTGEIKLTDLNWDRAETSWASVRLHRNAEGNPLRLAGQPVAFGLGAHANSVIVYDVPAGMTRFRARAGLDSQGTDEGCGSTVEFFVYGQDPHLAIRRVGGGSAEREEPRDAPALALLDPAPKVPPGFVARLIYRVPREQGSWVSLTADPQGRLIASDQFGKLYRVTLGDGGAVANVEPLAINVGQAQGLLCAFDALYVVVNAARGGPGDDASDAPPLRSGLYRVRDTNGDDQYDRVELLRPIQGSGEHGPHAVVSGPEGRSLYVLAGNATRLPAPEQSFVPRNWQPDELLPRLGQTDGFWRPDAPGGWIARTDPEGRQWELVAIGLRNPYDLAFNAEGELFTFDADMEWDVGTPWYRPTRVNHVTSGGEFGWRTGSGKWPDHYSDSLPSVVDIGASSPTGLEFGYRARFPERYRQALFMGDWSYGKIFALRLQPQGATYAATVETFLSGAPLPVTDLVVRPHDGALYFATGGRGIASALYRVAYVGTEPNAPGAASADADPTARTARAIRRQLERFHGRRDAEAVAAAWLQLASPDRYLRYAARIALEHQPVSEWRQRALMETNPPTALAALIALARNDEPKNLAPVVHALGRMAWQALDERGRLDLLRAYTLAFTRMGPPDRAMCHHTLAHLDAHFPTRSARLDRELAQLLIYLRAPGIVGRALKRLAAEPLQEEQIFLVLSLRTVEDTHWTLAERREYFGWFHRAADIRGGVSFEEFLSQIKADALERLAPERLAALSDVLQPRVPENPYAALQQRQFVKEWTVDELLPAAQANVGNRQWERGREVFHVAACAKCHRFAGAGGLKGPDLTGVGSRFDLRTLLESILEPSKVISDQFEMVAIRTRDGEIHTGRIGDHTAREILLKPDVFNQANLLRIRTADVEKITPSTLSMMPSNLMDVFTREEILDLLAYLRAAGR